MQLVGHFQDAEENGVDYVIAMMILYKLYPDEIAVIEIGEIEEEACIQKVGKTETHFIHPSDLIHTFEKSQTLEERKPILV